MARTRRYVDDNIAPMPPLDNVAQDMLLQAVNQFKERIIPAFTKVEAQMEEIVSLRKDLDVAWREKEQVATRYRKARKVEMDVQRMRESVAQVSGERDKALLLAEQACQETVKLREAKEASTSTIAVLEEENERYRGQLQRHMELVGIQVSCSIQIRTQKA